MMTSFAEFIREAYPFVASAASVAGLLVMVWLRTHFTGLRDFQQHRDDYYAHRNGVKEDIARIESRLHQLDNRVEDRFQVLDARFEDVQKDLESSPTRVDLMKSMASITERLSHMEATTQGISSRLATQNQYLHTIIEKGLKG